MKNVLFALAALFLISTTQAKLGYTLEQCRNEYGAEVKSEPAWCGGQAYSFIHDGYYIYVIIPAESDKVADITYFDSTTWKPLGKEQRDYVWSQNLDPNKEWETGPNWNGKHGFKKPYQHWVIYGKSGSKSSDGMVENAGLSNKAGWQIRTLTQYRAEYKFSLTMTKQ
jgi:hypothetical protein